MTIQVGGVYFVEYFGDIVDMPREAFATLGGALASIAGHFPGYNAERDEWDNYPDPEDDRIVDTRADPVRLELNRFDAKGMRVVAVGSYACIASEQEVMVRLKRGVYSVSVAPCSGCRGAVEQDDSSFRTLAVDVA